MLWARCTLFELELAAFSTLPAFPLMTAHAMLRYQRMALLLQEQTFQLARKLVNKEDDGSTPLFAAVLEGKQRLVTTLLSQKKGTGLGQFLCSIPSRPMSAGRCSACC